MYHLPSPQQITEELVRRGRAAVERIQQRPQDARELFGNSSLEFRLRDMDVMETDARDVHDGALAALTCGWLPPLRPSVVFSLKHPAYALEPCDKADCEVHGCKGNRFDIYTIFICYSGCLIAMYAIRYACYILYML